MKKQQELIITISPTGNTEMEVINGNGKACTKLSKGFEEVLGTVETRKFKPEAKNHQQQKTKNRNLNQANF